MQRNAKSLIGSPVVSMHTSNRIGLIKRLFVRPKDLKIELLEVITSTSLKPYYLLPHDIKLEDAQKLVVDSHQNLSEGSELVRHQEVIKQAFVVFGCRVFTQQGKKLGKVADYTFDPQHFFVAKICVDAPGIRKFFEKQLMIDRSDIVDVTKNKIVVKDTLVNIKKQMAKPLPATK